MASTIPNVAFPDIVACARCGAVAGLTDAQSNDWLVAWRPGSSRLVVRCPAHVSQRARRAAGLPGRESLARVRRLIEGGMWVAAADGQFWWAAPSAAAPAGYWFSPIRHVDGQGWEALAGAWYFATLPALVIAMSRVADLRRWRKGLPRL